jgi:hypothetical protein
MVVSENTRRNKMKRVFVFVLASLVFVAFGGLAETGDSGYGTAGEVLNMQVYTGEQEEILQAEQDGMWSGSVYTGGSSCTTTPRHAIRATCYAFLVVCRFAQELASSTSI